MPRTLTLPRKNRQVLGLDLKRSESSLLVHQVRASGGPTAFSPALPVFGYLTNCVWSAYLLVARGAGITGIVEDVMRLELQYRSDVDLSQPAMQVEIRSHILRCLRDFPQDGEGGVIITLGGVEHCFMYTVHDDVVIPS